MLISKKCYCVKKLIKSFVVNHKACKMALKIIKYVKSS